MQNIQSGKTLAITVLVLSCLLPITTSFANPFEAQNKKDLRALVARVTKNRVVYVDHFPGPENLTGIILKGLNQDSKKIIAWNPPGTDLLMIGRLVDATGTDLTQVAHDYFLSESNTSDPLSFETIESELKFFQFSSPASLSEKTIHIITDPSCVYCARLGRDMISHQNDLVNLDIRIVPIAQPGNETAAVDILKHGPDTNSAVAINQSQKDVDSIKHNTKMLLEAFPKLSTPMILVDGKPVKNTIDALLNEVPEDDS